LVGFILRDVLAPRIHTDAGHHIVQAILLKEFIDRVSILLGKDFELVFGGDCHMASLLAFGFDPELSVLLKAPEQRRFDIKPERSV
jgi:hypothetical protein